MILATGVDSNTGRNVLFLGLSAENVRRMAEGEPIEQPMDEMGMTNLEVVIFGGWGTEDELRNYLIGHVGSVADDGGMQDGQQ